MNERFNKSHRLFDAMHSDRRLAHALLQQGVRVEPNVADLAYFHNMNIMDLDFVSSLVAINEPVWESGGSLVHMVAQTGRPSDLSDEEDLAIRMQAFGLLRDRGYDLEMENDLGLPPMCMAVDKRGEVNSVKALCRLGARPEASDGAAMVEVFCAGSIEMTHRFLSPMLGTAKCVEFVDRYSGSNVLIMSDCFLGHERSYSSVASVLLQLGANPRRRNEAGWDPVTSLLLRARSRKDRVLGEDGPLWVHPMAKYDQDLVCEDLEAGLRLLLERGADPDPTLCIDIEEVHIEGQLSKCLSQICKYSEWSDIYRRATGIV